MALVRFLIGSGWWTLWYLAFYAAILLFVVLILAIFAQELKPAGQKPHLASPGSALVFTVALVLGALTCVNAILFVVGRGYPWYADVALVIGLSGAVTAVGFVLNSSLATQQSYSAFYANVAYTLITIVINLGMMSTFASRPAGN